MPFRLGTLIEFDEQHVEADLLQQERRKLHDTELELLTSACGGMEFTAYVRMMLDSVSLEALPNYRDGYVEVFDRVDISITRGCFSWTLLRRRRHEVRRFYHF